MLRRLRGHTPRPAALAAAALAGPRRMPQQDLWRRCCQRWTAAAQVLRNTSDESLHILADAATWLMATL